METASLYDDIYVRDNFNDSGETPSTGIPYISPDIIPYQGGLLTWQVAIDTYSAGPDNGKPIINNGLNNIYVRAKNLQQIELESGSVSLYYSKASLLLLPSKWSAILTSLGKAKVNFINRDGNLNASPNEILLGSEAFVLTGLSPVQGDHYCLISIVKTPKHTVTIPENFATNAKFAEWVQNNPAIAWRNISYISNTLTQVVVPYAFGNINDTPADFHVRIMTTRDHNFPIGTGIRVVCTDLHSRKDWSGMLESPDEEGRQITGFDWRLPGNYNSSLTATFTSPDGKPFPPAAKCSITLVQYPSDNPDETERKVMSQHAVSYLEENGRHITSTKSFIKVGECWLYVRNT